MALILERNRYFLVGIIAFAFLIFTQISAQAYEAWGGWSYGAKLIGGYQSLTIGSALLDSSLNIGQMPSVTTGTPTNVGSTATLNGNISSMGVASSTYAYFTWSQSGVTHNTPLQTKSATGAVTATIAYDPNKPLNVIFITQVGAVQSTGSWVTLSPIQGNTFFKTFIPILFGVVVAFVILSVAFSVGITIQVLALAAVGGTLAYYVVAAIVNLLF